MAKERYASPRQASRSHTASELRWTFCLPKTERGPCQDISLGAARDSRCLRGLAVGGHDGSYLIVDRIGRVDFVVGIRSHTGEVFSVYLMNRDIEQVMEFVSRKHN